MFYCETGEPVVYGRLMGITQIEATEHLREALEGEKISWIVASTKAGAGHKRQARHLERYLKEYLHQEAVETVDISLEGSKSFLVRWGTMMYNRYMQNSPRVYEQVEKILAWPVWNSLLDEQVRAMAKPEVFEGVGRRERSVVATTHAAGAVSAVRAGFPEVVEYVPDPWRGGSLRLMSSPERAEDSHLTVVHGPETANRLGRMRSDGRTILPWGTLSNPDFVVGKKVGSETRREAGVLRVLVEMSGNNVPGYNEKIAEWVREAAGEIRRGSVDLTLHCMHHKEIYRKFFDLAAELNLENTDRMHILAGDNIKEAIEGRERCITGGENGKPPDVCIAKGGEVPLEERGGMVVAMPWGWGHEEADLLAGVQRGVGVDLRKVHPREWLKIVKEKRQILVTEEQSKIQNWSLLAVGLLVDPEYFGKVRV